MATCRNRERLERSSALTTTGGSIGLQIGDKPSIW